MEFNITPKKLISIINKCTFTSGIDTLRIIVSQDTISIDAVAISQDRLAQLTLLLEGEENIVEEGIWDIGDPQKVVSKLKMFKPTDMINVKIIENKVNLSRKKPKKAYKLPIGIEEQINSIPPVKVSLSENLELNIHVKNADSDSSRGKVQIGFIVDAGILKDVSKETLFSNEVTLTVENSQITIKGKEGEEDSEEEIVGEVFLSSVDKVSATYKELHDVFRVLSSDSEIKVYFSTNTMIVIEEKNKYMKVQYIVMEIIYED